MKNPAPDSTPFLRSLALRVFSAALAAADPEPLVRRLISCHHRTVSIDGRSFTLGTDGRVVILAAGKAAAPMARAAEQVLGTLADRGIVVVKEGHGLPIRRLDLLEAGHPEPDRRSLYAAKRMLRLATTAGARDLVLCLFSGGASSLLTAPAQGLILEDLRRTTALLIGSGADIGDINCVRKHLSSIKGGLLARAAAPAGLATLLLSDVVGDRPEVIASGPSTPDPDSYEEALTVLRCHQLEDAVPDPVRDHLLAGCAGSLMETPGPSHPCFHGSVTRVVGSNRHALLGAEAEAARLGCRAVIQPEPIIGEARYAASQILAGSGRETSDLSGGPTCHISGGETVVTLPGDHGRGGRNMELALAAAPLLAGHPSTVLLSAGTDGSDGPTDAAGAVVDGGTMARAGQMGLNHDEALRHHNAYDFFQVLGDLVITGPTRTNVQDLQILIRDTGTPQK